MATCDKQPDYVTIVIDRRSLNSDELRPNNGIRQWQCHKKIPLNDFPERFSNDLRQ